MSDPDQGSIDVIVPQVGEAIAEVTLVRWLKKVGETVSKGEPLFEVDTEKATFEIEAFADGVLVEIVADAGSSVSPLQVVARLAPSGAAISQPVPLSVSLPAASTTPSNAADMTPRRQVTRRGPLATPRARRVAAELGVDLNDVVGTGERGMITTEDVEGATGTGTAEPSRSGSSRVERMPAARAAVARRVQRSKQNVPHFYLQADVDMSAVERLRHRSRTEDGNAPSVTSIIVHACSLVIAANPSFNVSYRDGEVEYRDEVAIGVAVDTDAGVLVPVIRRTDSLSLAETSARLIAAIERARAARLRPEDAVPKSMVVSNLGMHGVDAFFAIIDEPDPLILSVGRTTKRLVVVDEAAAIRPMATFGLSIDHRVLDGVDGARFLAAFRDVLEQAEERLPTTATP
jgi:pyruvate dehydrogenase E2 component (dihydrolipoamide acetyltransferase)